MRNILNDALRIAISAVTTKHNMENVCGPCSRQLHKIISESLSGDSLFCRKRSQNYKDPPGRVVLRSIFTRGLFINEVHPINEGRMGCQGTVDSGRGSSGRLKSLKRLFRSLLFCVACEDPTPSKPPKQNKPQRSQHSGKNKNLLR